MQINKKPSLRNCNDNENDKYTFFELLHDNSTTFTYVNMAALKDKQTNKQTKTSTVCTSSVIW